MDDGPTVIVTDLGFGKNGSGLKRGGLFDPGVAFFQYPMRDIVKIDPVVANAYERGHGWMTFEGVLLHECVHWARINSGNGDEPGGSWNTLNYEYLDNPNEPGAAFEAGDLFDLWAYGFDICQMGSKRQGRRVRSTGHLADQEAARCGGLQPLKAPV